MGWIWFIQKQRKERINGKYTLIDGSVANNENERYHREQSERGETEKGTTAGYLNLYSTCSVL